MLRSKLVASDSFIGAAAESHLTHFTSFFVPPPNQKKKKRNKLFEFKFGDDEVLQLNVLSKT